MVFAEHGHHSDPKSLAAFGPGDARRYMTAIFIWKEDKPYANNVSVKIAKGGIIVWYYKNGETQIGPIRKEEVQQLIDDRKINGATLVRKEGAEEWQPLKKLAKKKPRSPDAERQKSSIKDSASLRSDDGGNQSVKPLPVEQVEVPAGESLKASPQNIPFTFSGTGREYFKIWIVNIVLSVVTLGIYSAWAKVRRKQYFYGCTEVDSASFQYLADPLRILKGRIIVFAGFIAYSIINQLYPFIGIALILVLLFALPWFVVRSLSFNARNSAIRNIRFNFYGTYWEAAKVFILLPLLLPLTLGFIFPYLFYRQKKFVVNNSTYGTVSFDFQATAKDYYMLLVGLLLPLVFCIALSAVANFLLPVSELSTPLLALVFVVFYLYSMAYVVVKSSNLLYNSSNLAEHGFKATMAIKEYIFILITNTIGTVLTLGLFHPFAKVRAYRYQIEHLALVSAGDLNEFVAAEQEQVTALGDEIADFMDIDVGI